MNKQNQYYENQISTAIHDSCQKSTYSSKFIQTKKRNATSNNTNKKILPSKYQKSAIFIQRFWRFRQYMKRLINQRLIQDLSQTNQCFQLQNSILQQIINRQQQILDYKQKFIYLIIKQKCSDIQEQISNIKKQCVMMSFRLEKNNPTKQLFQSIIQKKQQSKELNLMLNREKFNIQEQLQQQNQQYEKLLNELKKLNMAHLELVQSKNQLSHHNKEKFLQTSKFGNQKSNSNSEKKLQFQTKKQQILKLFNQKN